MVNDRRYLGPCLDPEAISAYAVGTLGSTERAQAEVHFTACDDCNQVLEGLLRDAHEGVFEGSPVVLSPLPKDSEKEIKRGEDSFHLPPPGAQKRAKFTGCAFIIIVVIVGLAAIVYFW